RLNGSPWQPLAGQGLGSRKPYLRQTALGCLLGAGLVSLAALCIKLVGDLRFFPVGYSAHSAFVGFLVLWVLATAAMLEEVMFRGYPFQRLIEATGPFFATLLLSLFFAAIHLGNPNATRLGAAN